MTVDRHALLLLTGRSAVAFALLAVAVAGHSAPLLGFDSWLSSAARTLALAHPLWRAVMAAVTLTGSTAIIGPLTTAGCALLLASGRWRQAVFAAIAVGATIGVRLIVVAAVARPRPAGRLVPAANFASRRVTAQRPPQSPWSSP
jgi:undecaprenyl-diphosphatase